MLTNNFHKISAIVTTYVISCICLIYIIKYFFIIFCMFSSCDTFMLIVHIIRKYVPIGIHVLRSKLVRHVFCHVLESYCYRGLTTSFDLFGNGSVNNA